jgi:hypothetical protein
MKEKDSPEASKTRRRQPDQLPIRNYYFRPDKIGDEYCFPEEAVAIRRRPPKGVRTDKPRINPAVPIELEGRPRTLANTVGHRFKHAPKPKNAHDKKGWAAYRFDRYTHLLMDVIRDYNRALYRLRRSHVFKDFPADFGRMCQLPDEDERFVLTSGNKDSIHEVRCAIEDEFERAAKILEKWLHDEVPVYDPPTKDRTSGKPDFYFHGRVDCIRVNDYIVSVRIMGGASTPMLELPYSSSSFTSISSAFSSYSSTNAWQAGPPSS